MTDELVDCFNCGRANPQWAQVCRACGVPLRHGEALTAPSGRIPTDRNSLLSIGAVIGTILLAVVVGLLLSTMNPIDPSVGREVAATPTPSSSPTVEALSSEAPEPTDTPVPEPTATPGPAGTVTFGTDLDANRQVVAPVETFTPGMVFAHSISVPEPFGVATVGEQIVRIDETAGTEEEIVRAVDNQPTVDPASTMVGFEVGDAADLIAEWGPGLYEMRVYAGDTIIAVGRFRLSEG